MARDADNAEKPQSDYQVFLSFRGCDTRQAFTDCLYHFLTDAGVRVYRDNEELRPGHKIKEVLAAINKSIVCIPILSKNYANSKWCLLELAKMVELEKDIMPIFYKVEADDVKLKTKLYSDHLSKFGKEYDANKEEWERALKEVGGIFDKSQLEGTFKEVGRIKAWTIVDYPGYGQLCKEVVREVLNKLEVKHKILDGPLVGIGDHVQAIKKLLCTGSPDVRFVAIHGVGGVGKTTLAKVIFNQLYEGFRCCCFLSNVRETIDRYGIVYLQKKLLRELGPRTSQISDSDSGIKTIKDIVRNKKVLIILDDLDQRNQIKNLAGDSTWFDSGSRIIVTTRDPSCVAEHSKIWYYNMSEMSSDHALQLFCRHAFKEDSPPIDCLDISKEFVAACGRLPLALEVTGSHLYHTDRGQWRSKLDMIASQNNIQEKLMINFKMLDYRTKEIFLDIACFFIGSEKKYPVYMWEACDFRPDEGIDRLISLSLVKISDDNTFWIHDALRGLGREIVVQENFKRPGRRSRLWSSGEVERVLSRWQGTRQIDALRLLRAYYPEDGFGSSGSPITANHIRPLQNLRFLELQRMRMEGNFEDALQDLKWFSWHSVGALRVTILELKDIVILDLSHSNFSPDLLDRIQIGQNLKVLNLSHFISRDFSPDDLKLPETLGNWSSLVELDISHSPVRTIPTSIGNLKNLRVMRMSWSRVKQLPSSIGNLEKLEELHAEETKLEYIPEDIGRLHQLRILNMENSKFPQLPSIVDQLPLLQHLFLEKCDRIQELPNFPSSLTILRVSSASLRKLPNLLNLKLLNHLVLEGNRGKLTQVEKLLSSASWINDCPVEEHLSSASWINDCPLLESFELAFRNITHIQMETSAFPRLKQLRLSCPDLRVIEHLPLSLTMLHLSAIIAEIRLPTFFTGMKALDRLELSKCRFTGGLLLPTHLKILCINRCIFPQPSIDLSRLKMLQHLAITNCESLMAVGGVENMKLLEKVVVMWCPSLKEISDLSKFERLVVETDDLRPFRGFEEIISEDRGVGASMGLEAVDDELVRRFARPIPSELDFTDLMELNH